MLSAAAGFELWPVAQYGSDFLSCASSSKRGISSPQCLHCGGVVPGDYPFVVDLHAEAGGVGGGDVAVFGHGHAGDGADFFEGDAGV